MNDYGSVLLFVINMLTIVQDYETPTPVSEVQDLRQEYIDQWTVVLWVMKIQWYCKGPSCINDVSRNSGSNA